MSETIYRNAIAIGTLRHRRTFPKIHDFQYPVTLFYLDLDDLKKTFPIRFLMNHEGASVVGFRQEDYLRSEGTPGEPLSKKIEALIATKTGKQFKGSVRALTQLRYFGFCFNPVSFYFCFQANHKTDQPDFIIAEITNTPWNERKTYVLDCESLKPPFTFQFQKDFHVSPFMPMDLTYVWRFFQIPSPQHPHPLVITMEDWTQGTTPQKIFTANLQVKFQEHSPRRMAITLLKFPFLTFKSLFAIYFQAFLLHLKRVPFFSHPKGVS